MSRGRRRHAPSRLGIVFVTSLLAVPTVEAFLGEGMRFSSLRQASPYLAVGALLGVAQCLLRPLLRILTLPLGCLTLGLFGIAIDVGLVYLSAYLVPGYPAPRLVCALATALLINLVTGLLRARR